MISHFEESQNRLLDENKALIAKVEALKTQVNAVRGKLDWISGFMVENTEYKVFNKLFEWGKSTDNLLASTPEQCLNSVKADAIDYAFNMIDGCDEMAKAQLMILDYTEKLRK